MALTAGLPTATWVIWSKKFAFTLVQKALKWLLQQDCELELKRTRSFCRTRKKFELRTRTRKYSWQKALIRTRRYFKKARVYFH